MTNEQLLDMVRMRIDGCTFSVIGDKYGITRQAAEQSIKSICGIKRGRHRKVSSYIYGNIVYPNIRNRMIELGWGYTSLADKTGKSVATIRNVLIGFTREPRVSLAKQIASALELDVETAFERGGQDDA